MDTRSARRVENMIYWRHPELENRAEVVSLPANLTRGHRGLKFRAWGHGEYMLLREVPI